MTGRAYGGWSSTGASILGLQTAECGTTLAARRGLDALLRPDIQIKRALHPFLDALLLRVALYRHGGSFRDRIEMDLVAELGRRRRADGSWPVADKSREGDPIFVTSLARMALQPEKLSALLGPPLPVHPPLLKQIKTPGGIATILVSLPAEPADTFLFDDSLLAAAAKSRLIFSYDPFDAEMQFIRNARDIGIGQLVPWARALSDLGNDADLRHVTFDALPNFFRDKIPASPEYLLTPKDIATIAPHLHGDAGRQLAAELLAANIPATFARAREAWASGDELATTAAVEAMIPNSLRGEVTALRRISAEKLATELAKPGNCFVLLDAWLALGPDGVFARLKPPAPLPR